MPNKVKPTAKQAKALELIRQGEKPTVAMKAAGYSERTSRHPAKNLLGATGAKTLIEQQLDAYAIVGITPHYLAEKTKEWLKAEKVDHSHTEPDKLVPDYQTQLKAAEMVRTDLGYSKDNDFSEEATFTWRKR
jgi:phage terminase small subunit